MASSVLALLTLAAGFHLPFQIAFEATQQRAVVGVNALIAAAFLADIGVNFRTTRPQESGNQPRSPRRRVIACS